MFNAEEMNEFLEMMDNQRPVTIRLNTLKTSKSQLTQLLASKGVEMEIVDQISELCFKINKSPVPVGATTEYLAGMYMIQSAASILPVIILDPQPGEYVLDMAAAPGGKTTHVA
jgi:ribosomal RNA methyltransferase Nop2